MRSVTNGLLAVAAAAGVFLAAAAVDVAVAQQPSGPPVDVLERPEADEVARALEALRADPNLATERTVTTLRWKDRAEKKPPSRVPRWLTWIVGLFGWLARSARVLMWGAAIALAAVLVVYITRIVRKRGVPIRETAFVAPTHVRDLDIRPETLPDDIGAAARALWDRGEHRASFALLYRGLLSRLAHVYRVPIRDSTTEGDCLTLAARRLAPASRDYASRVIGVWQRAVYGRAQVEPSIVYRLCDEFAAALGTVSRADTPAAEGSA